MTDNIDQSTAPDTRSNDVSTHNSILALTALDLVVGAGIDETLSAINGADILRLARLSEALQRLAFTVAQIRQAEVLAGLEVQIPSNIGAHADDLTDGLDTPRNLTPTIYDSIVDKKLIARIFGNHLDGRELTSLQLTTLWFELINRPAVYRSQIDDQDDVDAVVPLRLRVAGIDGLIIADTLGRENYQSNQWLNRRAKEARDRLDTMTDEEVDAFVDRVVGSDMAKVVASRFNNSGYSTVDYAFAREMLGEEADLTGASASDIAEAIIDLAGFLQPYSAEVRENHHYILELKCAGLSTVDIARNLGVEVGTIYYRLNLFKDAIRELNGSIGKIEPLSKRLGKEVNSNVITNLNERLQYEGFTNKEVAILLNLLGISITELSDEDTKALSLSAREKFLNLFLRNLFKLDTKADELFIVAVRTLSITVLGEKNTDDVVAALKLRDPKMTPHKAKRLMFEGMIKLLAESSQNDA